MLYTPDARRLLLLVPGVTVLPCTTLVSAPCKLLRTSGPELHSASLLITRPPPPLPRGSKALLPAPPSSETPPAQHDNTPADLKRRSATMMARRAHEHTKIHCTGRPQSETWTANLTSTVHPLCTHTTSGLHCTAWMN